MKQNKGITLVALVVTIIILLILASITISALGGENGLIAKVNQAKKAQIKAEMKETLILAINELQLEKEGKATLDDITQEWADNALENYNPQITNDASINGKKITMKKDNVTGKYIIDENLNITEVEENSSIEFSYEVFERIDNKVKILIRVQDKENGLSMIELPGEDVIIVEENKKEEKGIDYEVELGVEYKIKITSEGGQIKEETILITDYWYTITKDLEGVEIDNPAIKVAYNKPYKAIITTEEGTIPGITVEMGGQRVTTDENNIVDKTTGKIYIKKVTGDIKITAGKRLYLIKDGINNEELIGEWEGIPYYNRETGSLVPEDGKLKYIGSDPNTIYVKATKSSINYDGYNRIKMEGEVFEKLNGCDEHGIVKVGLSKTKNGFTIQNADEFLETRNSPQNWRI